MMKKLALIISIVMLLASTTGCLVKTNETMPLPGTDADGNEYGLFTYYGEAVAPISTEGLAFKDVNVIGIDLEGAKTYKAAMTPEESEGIENGEFNDLDYTYSMLIDEMSEFDPSEEAEEAEEAEAEEAPEAQSDIGDALDETFEEYGEDAEQAYDEMMGALAEYAEGDNGKEMFDSLISLSGLSIAAYRASDIQERVDAHYPGYTATAAYTLMVYDSNGLYPAKGPKTITIKTAPGEAQPDMAAIVAPNGALAGRVVTKTHDYVTFTVPSTPGTLILLLSKAAAAE